MILAWCTVDGDRWMVVGNGRVVPPVVGGTHDMSTPDESWCEIDEVYIWIAEIQTWERRHLSKVSDKTLAVMEEALLTELESLRRASRTESGD